MLRQCECYTEGSNYLEATDLASRQWSSPQRFNSLGDEDECVDEENDTPVFRVCWRSR